MSARRLRRLALATHDALMGLCGAIGAVWLAVLVSYLSDPLALLFMAAVIGGCLLRLAAPRVDLQSIAWRLRRRRYAWRRRLRRRLR